MKRLGVLLFTCSLLAAATPPAGFPFTDETLTYSIVWPSGLSLGEGKLDEIGGQAATAVFRLNVNVK